MGGYWSGTAAAPECERICALPEKTCLDRFIQLEIQASRDFVRPAQSRIDAITRILHGPSFPYHVAEVFKTGSLGQGTALRCNLSDIDLVVYLNNHSVEKITYNIHQILSSIHEALRKEGLPGYRCLLIDSYRLAIQLEAQGQTFEVDLLPGKLVSGTLKGMYQELYNEDDDFVQEHYSVSFAKQQKLFLARRETKLKNLFQLMKYWSKVDLKDFGCSKVPSYLISLIVIYTWENYGEPRSFKTEIGFKAVLTTLANYDEIQKVWFEYYDERTWRLFGEPAGPYLMDPANPSSNMLYEQRENLSALAQAAGSTINSPLLRNIAVSQNWL